MEQSESGRGVRRWNPAVIWGLSCTAVVLVLAAISPAVRALIWHLIVGWGYFLHRNLSAMALDFDIVMSGVVATVLAWICLHLMAGWWFGVRWRWRHSAMVVAAVGVLFAASFLVPGVILMFRLPLHDGWLTF